MNEPQILLIEDDPSDARLIQRAFDRLELGVKVTRLTNGDDAVSYLAGEEPFDNRLSHPLPSILLLDIKLPRRSGFEVLAWLRRRTTGLKRIPVVMLTSSRHSVDVNRAYDLGANSYLTKPATAAELGRVASDVYRYWMQWNQGPEVYGNSGTYSQ